MHRRKLLDSLKIYRNHHREESDLIERFTVFLEENVNCFDRQNKIGHVTGSAWLLHPDHNCVLLTHHKKLNRWLQLGGHSDGESDTLSVAIREATEESGLTVRPMEKAIFDIDVHEIPRRENEPAHLHFDVRFLLEAADTDFVVSHESNDLRWVKITEIDRYTDEGSVLRMRDKWLIRLE